MCLHIRSKSVYKGKTKNLAAEARVRSRSQEIYALSRMNLRRVAQVLDEFIYRDTAVALKRLDRINYLFLKTKYWFHFKTRGCLDSLHRRSIGSTLYC